MKALVTGGAGFIGSHLVDALVERGGQVVVLDNLHRGSRDNLQAHQALDTVQLIEGDIRNMDAVISASVGCDVVFHLAAQANVMGALADSDYSVTTNVVGTDNVLRAASHSGVRRVVFTSSREVYGEPASLPVPETAPLQAKNLYGASKIAGEAYCAAWTGSRGMECQVVRIANVYGPRDKDRVISLWLDAVDKNEDLQLYGGDQIIDFVWVGTVVGALIAASEFPLTTPVNIGSGRGTGLRELASRILALRPTGSKLSLEPARDVEVVRYVAEVSRMRSRLGVEPDSDSLVHLTDLANVASR